MTRDDIKTEILEALNEKKSGASPSHASTAANNIMKKVDEYVESCVIKARLEVMKNFGAI